MSSEPKRPRGRPKTSLLKRQRTRERIEATALSLFQTEGFAAVSMRRLAGEVGCSPMTLYSYFENKIDILRALWAQVFRSLFENLAEQVAEESDSKKHLLILATGYVRYWLLHPEHYRMVFMAEGISQPDVNVFVDDAETLKHMSLFADCLVQADGRELSLEDLKRSGDMLLSALHGIAHCQITMSGYSWTPADDLVEEILRAVTSRPLSSD